MVPQWIIEKKRDGEELAEDEISAFIKSYSEGTLPDYQMAALAMAIYFRGMSPAEISALTDAMMRSGEILDLSELPRPSADKHSTGGIGDKISLILAPLAAAAGMAAPMIAGRGLGITGGTLDKLEAIPGFQTNLPIARFKQILAEIGCCIIGQTASLAPADRKLYALRDVTGTVPSIPLITASIMSKKLAEGTETLVLDVKCGRGAFMRSLDDARELANSMIRVGRAAGRRMAALITAMEQPLGATIGNALEVEEALAILRGEGPPDVRALTIALTARMALLAGVESDLAHAEARLAKLLDNGEALAIFRRMIAAQGGEARVVDDPARYLPKAALARDLCAPRDGWLSDCNAEALGRVALLLGANRRRADEGVDHAVGISHLLPLGSRLARGQPLMRLHARTESELTPLLAQAAAAVTISDEAPPPAPLILEVLGECA